MKLTDEQLVARYLQQGEAVALEQLVKRYLNPLYAFARQYVGNTDTAADVVQETFVKVWKNLDKFDTKRNFRTWIFTIAKRTALDWLKQKSALPFSALAESESNFAENLVDHAPSILESLIKKEASRHLATAISQLPASHGAVVALRLNEELTFPEIARVLRAPLNTIKSRYRRGLMRLKELL